MSDDLTASPTAVLETAIDRAHAAMTAAPEDDNTRLRFYERVADAELFLLLEEEPQGDSPVTPRIFPVEDTQFVLVFDREERLAAFAGAVPYVALSGRSLAQMLSGSGLGLGLNLTVAPSEMLLPPEAVEWLTETLGAAPTETEGTPEEITPPHGLPESLVTALDQKLAITGGLARLAYLAGVSYQGGTKSHILAFVDHVPGSEGALAKLVSEALIFSGVEAGALDVAFFRPSDPACAALARHGLRFDLPEPEVSGAGPSAPGMDPSSPPKLR
ncbi:SseB family protein [Celeribacter sp.]|uniref:SseB family protein n=1 Tax=Celeribacter sp. TaxID=1890673 RepID=UPI003A950327